jgi:cysteine synthase A
MAAAVEIGQRRQRPKICDSILDTIGNTPLVRLTKLKKEIPHDVDILLKLEYFNPLSSVKDRIGAAMIEDAEVAGILKPGDTIVEPTSGNTGIGLAFVAATKGYRLILTMPETMSVERRKMLKALGADIVLTPGATGSNKFSFSPFLLFSFCPLLLSSPHLLISSSLSFLPPGMKGAIAKAEEIKTENPSYFMPQQFKNESNVKVHQRTTALEIWEDTDGKVDYLISGVGTGGTITGSASVLKQLKPTFKAIAVEPKDSPVLSGGAPGPHKIQGIGAGFIPDIVRRELLDEIVQVTNDEAGIIARRLAKVSGGQISPSLLSHSFLTPVFLCSFLSFLQIKGRRNLLWHFLGCSCGCCFAGGGETRESRKTNRSHHSKYW